MIHFEEHSHTYTYEGIKLPSVTTILKNLSPPFRKEYWSKYKALQALGVEVKSDASKKVPLDCYLINGKTFYYKSFKMKGLEEKALEIQEKWEIKRKSSADYGTYIHKQIEKAWEEEVEEDFINNFVNSERERIKPFRLEHIVHDLKYWFVGTSDGIMKILKSPDYEIQDHKTDEELEDSNRWQKFYPPIQHLDCCNMIKHTLQMNLYRHCAMLNFGINISRLQINHVIKKEQKIVPIEVPIMEKEVKLILNSLKK